MADAQKHVQRLLDELVASRRETGVQVAAHLHGERVVNTGAGLADPCAERPVDDRTLFHSWSTGKGLTAAVVHVLADRGRLSYDRPVAEYWPEFAAHGKQGITPAHVLVHTAGVPRRRPEPRRATCGTGGACATGSPTWRRCGPGHRHPIPRADLPLHPRGGRQPRCVRQTQSPLHGL
ncbi:serine hydrolase domain-containing protein [Nonomuraea sp. NPDC001699]